MTCRPLLSLVAVFFMAVSAANGSETSTPIGKNEILRGKFLQERFLTGFQAPLRSEGTFVLAPGRGLIWRVSSPFPTVTVITPAGLVQQNGDAELVRLSASRVPLLSQLYQLLEKTLLGDWPALRALYDVRISRDAGKWRVDLQPRAEAGPAGPFEAVSIAGGRFAETVELHKSGGDVDRLSFTAPALSSAPLLPEEAARFAIVGE